MTFAKRKLLPWNLDLKQHKLQKDQPKPNDNNSGCYEPVFKMWATVTDVSKKHGRSAVLLFTAMMSCSNISSTYQDAVLGADSYGQRTMT